MSAPASTRELSKAIAVFLPSAQVPLPDGLVQVIDGYLHKHATYDQGASDRLQDELLAIYHKHVEDFPPRYAAFLFILRLLRPAIRSPEHIIRWWDKLVEPVVGSLAQEKGLASEALANVENLLFYGQDDEADQEEIQTQISTRLIGTWMATFQLAQAEGGSDTALHEKLLLEVLLLFGKKKPQGFLCALNGFMVKRKHRSGALNLLSDFIQSQPPHLYQVFQTPLFDTLIRCLQNDTSTTIVSLALTSLVMLLPNVPTSLVSYLPTLFNVYARLLFWDRERSIETNGPQAVGPEGLSGNSTWEKCVYSPDVDDGGIPHLLGYFTILYGLYPINFMDYIRKPQRYLRHANAPNPDDIEVQPYEIRHRSERYRQWHLLHRNFYDLTLESEKTDFSRWIRSEPADVLADCIALCLAETDPSYPIETASGTRAVNPAAVDTTEGDAVDTSLLSGSMVLPTPESRPSRPASGGSPSSSRAPSALMRRSSQSSHPSTRNSVDARTREAGFDSPTLPPHLVVSPSQTDLQDMINSNKVIKSGLHQSLANDSVPSLSLSHHDPVSERVPSRAPAPYPSAYALSPAPDEASEQVARLRRQILLLKNDLSFERYLKQQHMNHIGTLRRRQVKEAATEAETQNLLMANRNLKQRLEDARKAETQVRKESEKSRALSNKWEADLSTKLRALREEQKKWMVEGTALKRALGETREENEKLRKMVCDAEVRQLSSQHTLQSIESRGQEMEWLKAEVARLEKADGDKQARVRELEAAQHDATEAGGQAEALRMEMTARASDMQRMKAAYETQIVVVNAKLAEALRSKRATDVEVQPMVESALAASRAKQLELQKQLSLLTRKYTVLQSSLLDLTSNSHLTRARTDPAASSDADAEVSAILGTPRSRTQRVFAEPDAGEGSSYHATPPLDGFGLGTSAGTVIHRPSTPTSSSRTDPGAASSTSPERERYFGRGGVQNAARKDRKDKKPEPEKKDKKSTGIRGIRGFV